MPEWNLLIPTDGSDVAPVPAPAERWESFLDLPWHLACWVRAVIHHGHTALDRDVLEGRGARLPEVRDMVKDGRIRPEHIVHVAPGLRRFNIWAFEDRPSRIGLIPNRRSLGKRGGRSPG